MHEALRVCALVVLLMLAGPTPTESEIIESKFELFVSRVDASSRFYETLGFEVVHRKPGGYTTLLSDSTVVALSPLPAWLPMHWFGFLRRPPLGTEIVFYADRLESLRSALEAGGHAPSGIVRQPWGDRDFRVTDPDGYYVRISEGHALPTSEPPAFE